MSNYYDSILAGLISRREALFVELTAVNAAIDAIEPLVGGETAVVQMPVPPVQVQQSRSPGVPASFPPPNYPTPDRYSRVSVRWAALWHLAEYAQGPMRNGEIADAILAGGYRTNAGSFPNAVSAVLHGMRDKGEIEGTADVGYWLTDQGKQTWALIRQGAKFREATSGAPNAPSLLSVQ